MNATGEPAAEIRFVDTPAELAEVCGILAGGSWFTLDTEFMRERTYYPQLCLIQVANESVIACIDPLALDDLAPLDALLLDTSVTKVLHAAGQDLEIFYHRLGRVPAPIFDTQLAASVLGLGEQTGYGKLVQNLLGVALDKSHARTDWSRRPLDPEQIRYAGDDVRYLLQLYPRMRSELDSRKRLDWLDDDLNDLTRPERYAPSPEEVWRRIRGSQQLKPRQLANLKLLAAWRENRAMELNKPRKWILQDEVLLELARRAPRDEQGLEKIRGLEERTLKRSGDELLEILEKARALPESEWPRPAPRRELSPDQDATVDALMALLRMSAAEHEISSSMIATRKDVEALVCEEKDLDLLKGWRRRLAGDRLLAMLHGELRLAVREGRLVAEAVA